MPQLIRQFINISLDFGVDMTIWNLLSAVPVRQLVNFLLFIFVFLTNFPFFPIFLSLKNRPFNIPSFVNSLYNCKMAFA